jgi:hypothetical protein
LADSAGERCGAARCAAGQSTRRSRTGGDEGLDALEVLVAGEVEDRDVLGDGDA